MKKSKSIVLISANVFKEPYPVYPLGISYLKTFLKKALPDFEVRMYDMNFGSKDDLATLLRDNDFGYVGLSLRNIDDNDVFTKNSFISWYKQLATVIRSNTDAIFILGGAGYSIFPEILLDELSADFGIKGEGEASLLALVKALDKETLPYDIEGLVFRQSDEKITINERKQFECSLMLQMEEQWLSYYWEAGGMLNIQTKRGCPHQCIYCSYPLIEGRTIRTLSPTEVVDTLKHLYFEKQITYFFFTDSVFNIDRNYNEELCQKIIESGIKINWGAYFSPRNLTGEELKLYKKAGLAHIEFGSESFSDQQLENYRKGFTWKDILTASHSCDELGIFYAHFMILAGYGETEKSLKETFEHSKLLNNTVIFPYIGMRIYPHTQLYDYALRDGKIESSNNLLQPVYYVSDQVQVDLIQQRAMATGAKWIFPGRGSEEMMVRFRKKKHRGPLWEYLKY